MNTITSPERGPNPALDPRAVAAMYPVIEVSNSVDMGVPADETAGRTVYMGRHAQDSAGRGAIYYSASAAIGRSNSNVEVGTDNNTATLTVTHGGRISVPTFQRPTVVPGPADSEKQSEGAEALRKRYALRDRLLGKLAAHSERTTAEPSVSAAKQPEQDVKVHGKYARRVRIMDEEIAFRNRMREDPNALLSDTRRDRLASKLRGTAFSAALQLNSSTRRQEQENSTAPLDAQRPVASSGTVESDRSGRIIRRIIPEGITRSLVLSFAGRGGKHRAKD